MPTNMGYQGTTVSKWQPQSPFVDSYADGEGPRGETDTLPRTTFVTESPFLSEVEVTGQLAAVDPASETVAELLGELHDPELDEAVYELVHEAAALAAGRLTGELGDSRAQEARIERMLEEHFAPLARHVEETFENMAEALAPLDPMSMTEAELEEVLDRAPAPPGRLSPSFEFFAKKMKKKGKKAVKGHVKAAKRGRAKPAHRGVLKKLGALVRPVLQKVLAFALDKIPAKYRPLATKLAEKLHLRRPAASAAKARPRARPKRIREPDEPSASDDAADPADAPEDTQSADPPDTAPAADDGAAYDVGPATADSDRAADSAAALADIGVAAAPPEESAPDITLAQSDMDVQIAELVLADNEEEMEAAVAETAALRRPRDPLSGLEHARRHFVRGCRDLRPGESAAPVVENFVPAILAAVRLGIKLIGRPRVVKFLGGLIGKLITPLVGKDLGPQLGQAIADIGLKVVLHAEVTVEDAREAAGRALATTVEETVRRVAALPEHVLESTALLEAHALEAFEAAAAASFPPALVRPDLREADGVNATWVSLPARGRPYYRKYGKVFDVEISPQVAAAVKTFGGRPLMAYLRDRLRLPATSAVRAKVHLYQLLPGGRLSHIAQHDPARGLGEGGAWKKLHPLDVQAATALLQHPRLGTPFPASPDALKPSVGQRFYYLEIDSAPHKAVGLATSMRAKVDFPGDEIEVTAFVGEPIAQEIAALLRKGGSPGVAIHKLRTALRAEAGVLAGDDNKGLLRFVLERQPGGPAHDTLASVALRAVRRNLRRQLGVKVVDWFWARVAEVLEKQSAAFIGATDGPEDGVTIVVTFHNPPGLQAVRKVLKGAAPGSLDRWPPPEVPGATVRFVAGQAP